MSRAVRSEFAAGPNDVSGPSTVDFYRIIGAVLERDLGRLEQLALERRGFLSGLEAALLGDADATTSTADLSELAALADLLEGVQEGLQFWREGNGRAARHALAAFGSAEGLLLEGGLVDTWLIVNSLREVFEESAKVSTWRRFRRSAYQWNALWQRYVRALAHHRPPIVELWPSQREALDQGLLDRERRGLVIRTPTSSGKTRMAEAAIIDAIASAPGAVACVYLVPFRALATEIESTLGGTLGALGIRVSSLFGGYESSDLEDFLLTNSDVLIVTPEKLDLVLRASDELRQRLALVVIDEGQLIGEGERGVRLELLLVRLRRRAPQARMLFLSAVVPNTDDVAAWLEPGGPGPIELNWRPTRLLVGTFAWQGRQGMVRYRATEGLPFFVPYVLRQTERPLGLKKNGQPRKAKLYPLEVKDVAAQLALHYEPLGPVVVFSSQKKWAASVAHAVALALDIRAMDGESDTLAPGGREQEINELCAFAASMLGADHELIALMRRGIGYHHSLVPEALRIRIEEAFRSGLLRVLASTTTLSQGVNLPVKTVIVSHTLRGRNDYVSVRDFWNIAGRAGRATRETEGQVILIASPTGGARARERERSYLDEGRVEQLVSRLARMLLELVRQRLPALANFSDLPTETELPTDWEAIAGLPSEFAAIDAQVLAMLCEEIIGTEDQAVAEAILGETLAGVQLSNSNIPLPPFARVLSGRARRNAEAVPDREIRLAFFRTGLSVRSCLALLDFVDGLLAETREELLAAVPDDWRVMRHRLLQGAFIPKETSATHEATREAAAMALGDWIDRRSIEELRAAHQDQIPALADPMEANAFIQETLVKRAPWALSAILALLQERLEEGVSLPPLVRALPAMAKFGVDTPEAGYAATLGVSERHNAALIAEAFRTADLPRSFASFLSWFSGLMLPDLVAILGDNPETRRLAGRVARLATTDTSMRVLLAGRGTFEAPVRGLAHEGRASRLAGVHVDDVLQLDREPDNPYDSNAIRVRGTDGEDLGYVAREVARGLAGVIDTGTAVTARVLSVERKPPALQLALSF
jgi:DEAD/DEAH box helicase/HIRAN domain/Helicase conserved C-terminal domain